MRRAGKKKEKAAPAGRQPASSPSTPEPKAWWEEYCRWKPRGAADQYDDCGRYKTIHEYDPLEQAVHELDDD